MKALWHPRAEVELNDVAAFYVARDVPEVAVAFLNEAQRIERLIREKPSAGRPLRDGIRTWRLRTFPYALIYRDKADHVRILAVAGERQRPFYWIDRE